MIAASRSVTFTDLIIMKAIETAVKEGFAPSKYRIMKIANEFIDKNNIQSDRATKITNSWSFQQHIDKLRSFLLVTPSERYMLTKTAQDMLDQLGKDWRNWPIYIPFTGTFRWDEAFYLN